jgi:hypothetical protein
MRPASKQLLFVQATVISSTITSQQEIFREIPIVCLIVITNQIWILPNHKVNDRRTLRYSMDFAVYLETSRKDEGMYIAGEKECIVECENTRRIKSTRGPHRCSYRLFRRL